MMTISSSAEKGDATQVARSPTLNSGMSARSKRTRQIYKKTAILTPKSKAMQPATTDDGPAPLNLDSTGTD